MSGIDESFSQGETDDQRELQELRRGSIGKRYDEFYRNGNPLIIEAADAAPGVGQQVKLIRALNKAKAAMGPAIKGRANPFFKSKYADLAECLDVCEPALGENGIIVLQPTRINASGTMVVVTQLLHEDGGIIEGEYLVMPAKPNDPQALGAATTYARRYGLMALLCLRVEDDDGNAASARQGVSTEVSARWHAPAPTAPLNEERAMTIGPKGAKPALGATPERGSDSKAASVITAPPEAQDEHPAPGEFRDDVEGLRWNATAGEWVGGGPEPKASRAQIAKAHVLQSELGIADAEWRSKLLLYTGKDSAGLMSVREIGGVLDKLEARFRKYGGKVAREGREFAKKQRQDANAVAATQEIAATMGRERIPGEDDDQ